MEDPLQEAGEWAILLSQKVGDVHDIRIGNVVLRFMEKQEKVQRLAEIHFTSND